MLPKCESAGRDATAAETESEQKDGAFSPEASSFVGRWRKRGFVAHPTVGHRIVDGTMLLVRQVPSFPDTLRSFVSIFLRVVEKLTMFRIHRFSSSIGLLVRPSVCLSVLTLARLVLSSVHVYVPVSLPVCSSCVSTLE